MKQSYVSPSMLVLHKKNRKINSSTTMCLKLATMLNPSLPVQNKLGEMCDKTGECLEDVASDYFDISYTGECPDIEPGYCGACLIDFPIFNRDGNFPYSPVKSEELQATQDQKDEAQKLIDKLPDEVKAIMPEIGYYVIDSTS